MIYPIKHRNLSQLNNAQDKQIIQNCPAKKQKMLYR